MGRTILRNRAKFDPAKTLVATRPMTFSGKPVEAGQVIKRSKKDTHLEQALPRLWASGRVEYKEDYQPVAVAEKSKEDIEAEQAYNDRLKADEEAAIEKEKADAEAKAAEDVKNTESVIEDSGNEDPAPDPKPAPAPKDSKKKAASRGK